MQPLKPKKQLGQHFLADENMAQRIVAALDAADSGPVYEIGPGMGVLTKYLLDRFDKVEAIEYDPDAVEYLQAAFTDRNLNVHHVDFLKWDFEQHLTGATSFIGNLPYNISSPIFFRFLENLDLFHDGVFMVQKEVADRVCAAESAPAKQKGILSVLINHYFETRMLLKVKPGAFRPPPKVMSAVFGMRRKANPAPVHFPTFKNVVKTAFNQRRKTLRNALKSLNVDWSQFPDQYATLRAEALPYAAFTEIANSLHSPDHED